MRRWLAPLLAVLATPAAAQEAPAWVGLWEGRVGTDPVKLCIDRFDSFSGSSFVSGNRNG